MSFSIIVVEQREKEAKALKSWLLGSLTGSIVLHIMALIVGVLLQKAGLMVG